MRRMALCVLALCVSACGSDGPTAPDRPSIQTVSGSYAGTVTMTFPEILQTLTCPATTTVTQTGANISVAPIVLRGACEGISLPLGSVTIDTNGALTNESGTFTDPDCGTYQYVGTGGFFGRTMQVSLDASSATCLDINMTLTLTR